MMWHGPSSASGLTGHVLGCWGFDVGQRRRLLLPDGTVKVMFALSGSIQVVDGVDGGEMAAGGSIGAGLGGRALVAQHSERLRGITVQLTPLAAYRLSGVPMREWAHRAIPLSELFGPWADRFLNRLVDAPSWERRFDVLDQALTRRFHNGPPVHPEIVWAHEQILARRGCVRVDQLAAEIGYSKRHLERLFATEVGLPPRALAQIVRVQHALTLQRTSGSFASASVAAGFHDQAHFIRAFKAIAGFSPSAFVAMCQRAKGLDFFRPGLSGTLLVA
jgi:AraC-like DNA-binding protein